MITKQTEKLRRVMKDLYLSTEVQCALFDEKGRIICEYLRGMGAFCGRVREIPELKEQCFACDRYGFEKAKTNKGTCTYTCGSIQRPLSVMCGSWKCTKPTRKRS